MGIEDLKSPTRLLNRDYVNKGGLDLSKEVLQVSVGQKAADLRAVKVGGQKKFYQKSRSVKKLKKKEPDYEKSTRWDVIFMFIILFFSFSYLENFKLAT